MLPRAEILAWRAEHAPWVDDDDVEQYLILTRAFVDIFSDRFLRDRLAFRGGTALHKLYLAPAARYSEDLDLVQRAPEPIGPTLDRLREALAWLGRARSETHEHPTLTFRFTTEMGRQPRRLKIEINSHEHFGSVVDVRFALASRPLTADVLIPTYSIDELLATKLRALYQRRKGRDLFDIWWAGQRAEISPPDIVRLFRRYMSESGYPVPRRAEFERNLTGKERTGAFDEVRPLVRPDVAYDPAIALVWFRETFLPLMDGSGNA
jgi:predicted nucleotidyltransferase component of viral defense system